MASKKTRKIGQIGARADKEKHKAQRATSSGRKRKVTGLPAGSRHSAADNASGTEMKVQKDPRLGSKKPIALVKAELSTTPKPLPKPRFHSPQAELDALENDGQLQALLDRLDAGKAISSSEQKYVEDKMARHQILCELLGLDLEQDDADDDDDPMNKLDARYLDDYKS